MGSPASIVSLINLTAPSTNRTLTPPGWRLLAVTMHQSSPLLPQLGPFGGNMG